MNTKVRLLFAKKLREKRYKKVYPNETTYFFYDELWLVLSFEFNHYGGNGLEGKLDYRELVFLFYWGKNFRGIGFYRL